MSGCLAVTPPSEDPVLIKLDELDRRLQAIERVVQNQSLVTMTQQLSALERRVAELQGSTVIFNVGYSIPVKFDLPEGISASIERNTTIKLSGIDKEKLGLTAAAIRKIRPPEPYKGKGVKYAKEHIRRKAGKAGVSA